MKGRNNLLIPGIERHFLRVESVASQYTNKLRRLESANDISGDGIVFYKTG
jgi:hypothetical protein